MFAETSLMQRCSCGQSGQRRWHGEQGTWAADHGVGPAVGADANRVGRAEDTDNGPVQRHRQVHRARIVGDAERRAADQGGEVAGRRCAREVARPRARRRDR